MSNVLASLLIFLNFSDKTQFLHRFSFFFLKKKHQPQFVYHPGKTTYIQTLHFTQIDQKSLQTDIKKGGRRAEEASTQNEPHGSKTLR